MKLSLNSQSIHLNPKHNVFTQKDNSNNATQCADDKILANIPQKRDLISFKGIKKSQLDSFDLAAVEKFGVQTQNIVDNDHLQRWAKTNFLALSFEKIKAKTRNELESKKQIFGDWYSYLEKGNDAYPNTLKYIIYSSLVEHYAGEKAGIPPELNKGALAETVSTLDNEIKKDRHFKVNFMNLYEKTIKNRTIKESGLDENETGWIIIPSKRKDPVNFDSNVEKLQKLSHHNWCTTGYNAKPYLSAGDFHIYMEKGKPKLGIRFTGDEIDEIEGPINNRDIPPEYYEAFKKHQKENNYNLSSAAIEQVMSYAYENIKDKKEYSIEDAEKMLKQLGYDYEIKKDGIHLLSDYEGLKNLTNDIETIEQGCGEEMLFKFVKKIHGNADFTKTHLHSFDGLNEITGDVYLNANSEINSFGTLKKIGGDLNIQDTIIEDFGELELIKGDLNAEGAEIAIFGNLKEICGNANFSYINCQSLSNLERIGGDANFENAIIGDLGELKRINGNANFTYAKFNNLNKLNHVGKDLDLSYSKIENIGELEYVGGNLKLENTGVKSLNQLKSVGKDLYIELSDIESLGELKTIGGNLEIYDCKTLKTADNLKNVKGSIYINNSSISGIDFDKVKVDGNIVDEFGDIDIDFNEDDI